MKGIILCDNRRSQNVIIAFLKEFCDDKVRKNEEKIEKNQRIFDYVNKNEKA